MSTLFLDRDGVINENRADYVKSWDEFCFLPGAKEAIARLTRQTTVSLFARIRLE
jgi:D-glycero-D-manno-heptose 1,7-bisphosphate phosphatase